MKAGPLCVALALAVGAAPVHADIVSPEWTTSVSAAIGWHHTTPAGVLVLGTRAGVLGIDGATGRTLWTKSELRDPDFVAMEVLPRAPFAVLTLARGIRAGVACVVLDVRNGHEAWDSGSLGIEGVRAHVFAPARDAMLLAGRSAGVDTVVIFDLATGRRLAGLEVAPAERATIFDEPVLFDTESTLVARSRTGLMRFDLRSGALLWSSPPLEAGESKDCIPVRDAGSWKAPRERRDRRPLPRSAPMLRSGDGTCIFVVRNQALHAVDVRDGHAIWNRPEMLCGRLVELAETERGVLARTMPEVSGNDEIVLIDRTTGAPRWQYPRRGLGSMFRSDILLGNMLPANDAVHVIAVRDLARIDLANGKSDKLGRIWVDSEGVSTRLERDGEGFRIVGRQEIQWLDARGKSVREFRQEPPEDVEALAFPPFPSSSRPQAWELMLADQVLDDLISRALLAVDRENGVVEKRIAVPRDSRFEPDPWHHRVYVISGKAILAFAL